MTPKIVRVIPKEDKYTDGRVEVDYRISFGDGHDVIISEQQAKELFLALAEYFFKYEEK